MGIQFNITAYLLWLIAFLGFPLGGLVANKLTGGVDRVPAAVAGGLIAGFIIGGAQWLVLRDRVDGDLWWIPATSFGMAAGLAAGSALAGYRVGIGDLALMGAVTGASVGCLQAAALSGSTGLWYVWAPVTAVLWALGWAVTKSVGVSVDERWTNFGASGAITAQALSGLVLWVLAGRA